MREGITTGGRMLSTRGIRGATTICEDSAEAILMATRELLLAILEANPELRPADIASVLFTVTSDLRLPGPGSQNVRLGRCTADVCARNPGSGKPGALYSGPDPLEHGPVSKGCSSYIPA